MDICAEMRSVLDVCFHEEEGLCCNVMLDLIYLSPIRLFLSRILCQDC